VSCDFWALPLVNRQLNRGTTSLVYQLNTFRVPDRNLVAALTLFGDANTKLMMTVAVDLFEPASLAVEEAANQKVYAALQPLMSSGSFNRVVFINSRLERHLSKGDEGAAKLISAVRASSDGVGCNSENDFVPGADRSVV
jgi:hypothetical protein